MKKRNQFYLKYDQRDLLNRHINENAMFDLFSREIKKIPLKANARILEIGFGEGIFLDWAQKKGYEIVGIDINPTFSENAKKKGHEVYLHDIRDYNFMELNKEYDLIALFDVLEHLTYEEILELFGKLSYILKKDGYIFARFPNGLSPLGLVYQYSDPTHQTVLSGPAIQDCAKITGLKVNTISNSETIRYSKGIRSRIKHILRRIMLFTLESFLSNFFFNKLVPMDLNLSVVLSKMPDTSNQQNK